MPEIIPAIKNVTIFWDDGVTNVTTIQYDGSVVTWSTSGEDKEFSTTEIYTTFQIHFREGYILKNVIGKSQDTTIEPTGKTSESVTFYTASITKIQLTTTSSATYKLTINGKPATINGKSKGTLTFGGKTYQWDNSAPAPTDELLGTWLFNEKISGSAVSSSVSFISYYEDFYAIEWGALSSSNVNLYYNNEMSIYIPVYESGSWNDEEYRTITITDTSTLTNREEFTAWLKANAVKQS